MGKLGGKTHHFQMYARAGQQLVVVSGELLAESLTLALPQSLAQPSALALRPAWRGTLRLAFGLGYKVLDRGAVPPFAIGDAQGGLR